MSEPAKLIDVMYPLLTILGENRDAPMGEAVGFELLVADSPADADLRSAYAEKLASWGCQTRAAELRAAAARIRAGERLPLTRYLPALVLRYPLGHTNMGEGESTEFVSNHNVARELLRTWRERGGALLLPTSLDHTGAPAWRVEFLDDRAAGTYTVAPAHAPPMDEWTPIYDD
ncbi:hypothetical protein [Frigoriglobus tundricola]|uniref:Uncharacterized protein n=1 Tax=Frigoriglobus tundricola TaxID=2774151 RepID=A0A6M5Z783_9BACT|nr:hypothetical protein [Frigoriglobus tundricola]QJX01244.1 hypothetical protein FTUN_8883 [Frigoriglobus tundricola]